MKVLLLSGGTSNEHDVSVRSGQNIAQALDELRHDYVVADPSAPGFELAKLTKDVNVVFLALHGEGGEDGSIQAELEGLGVPFTGSGSAASGLCWNKWKYKKFLKSHDLPVSQGRIVAEVIDSYLDEISHEEFMKPFVLKPNRGGSSLDTIIARHATQQDVEAATELLHKYPAGMLVEPLLEGIEITVGIFDKKPLPVIEIVPPKGREFDYENKYNGATQELCPPRHVSQEIQKKAQALAVQIHELTGCRHMSRTDMIVGHDGSLWVLETNTIPGLTEQSLLPKMLEQDGYSMPQFVDTLLHTALNRAL